MADVLSVWGFRNRLVDMTKKADVTSNQKRLVDDPQRDFRPSLEREKNIGLRDIVINIASSQQAMECRFWVGLYKRGELLPSQVCYADGVEDVLRQSAEKGLADSEALVISDALQEPPRYFYLMPAGSTCSFKEGEVLQDIINAISSWQPQKIGVYLAPDLLSSADQMDQLLRLLVSFVGRDMANEYYLWPGDYGFNAVLNTALKLKELVDSNAVEVRIWH